MDENLPLAQFVQLVAAYPSCGPYNADPFEFCPLYGPGEGPFENSPGVQFAQIDAPVLEYVPGAQRVLQFDI